VAISPAPQQPRTVRVRVLSVTGALSCVERCTLYTLYRRGGDERAAGWRQTLSRDALQQPARHAVTHTRRCWCSCDASTPVVRALARWAERALRWWIRVERSVGLARSPGDARDGTGSVGGHV
jgi:hypothetical protein